MRPSASLKEGHAALQTTVPMLVLPHDRLDAYAGRLHEAGLLFSVDLGPRSRALAGGLHTPEGIRHTPALYDAYQKARAGATPAWVFFCQPSLSEPLVQRALSLYYFLWYEVVDDASELRTSLDSARTVRQRRHRHGPSFVFMPTRADPLHYLASRERSEKSLQLRARRCERVATTLAMFLDDLQFQRKMSNVSAPLSGFQHEMWGKARKDPLVGAGPLTFGRAGEMTQAQRDDLFTQLSRMERIARAVDAAAGKRGTRVPVDAAAPGDEGGADRQRASRATPAVFPLPTLRGGVDVVWDAPAAQLVRLPLPLFLFHGGASDRSGKREMDLLRPTCLRGSARASMEEAIEHCEGLTAHGFERAAVEAAREAAGSNASAYRTKLLRQARQLNCDAPDDAPLTVLAGAIARRMYSLQVAEFLSAGYGTPPRAFAGGAGGPAAGGGSGDEPPAGGGDEAASDTSDEPPWVQAARG
jgi:hypothetical protein